MIPIYDNLAAFTQITLKIKTYFIEFYKKITQNSFFQNISIFTKKTFFFFHRIPLNPLFRCVLGFILWLNFNL